MIRRAGLQSFLILVAACSLMMPQAAAQQAGKASERSGGVSAVIRDVAATPGWIWRTGKRSFAAKNLKVWGIAAGAVAVASLFDDNLDAYVKREKPAPDAARFIDKTGHGLNLGLWAAAYAAGRITGRDRLTRTGQALLVSQLTTTLIGNVLWFGVGRERPDTAPDPHTFHPFDSDNLTWAFPPFHVLPSFPSAHTSGNFGTATVIARTYGLAYGLPFYAFGTAVGLSRIAREGHFLSDVVAGAFLGTITAVAATEIIDAPARAGTNMTLLPRIGADEVGIVCLLNF